MTEKAINVLLVEDNPGDALLFRAMLRESGPTFHEEYVERLSSALERLAKGGIDVVLLDLSLPDSHGAETYKKVLTAYPDVPIVLLTGLNDLEMSVGAIREGIQDYLVKGPLDKLLLSRCIRYAIERKRSEVLLRQSGKALSTSARMAAVGQLTGGIAHDFNNMLTVIFGQCEMLLGTPGLPEKVRKQVDEIYKAGERAASLTKQLLTFSRHEPVSTVVVDINKVVRDFENLLRKLIGEDLTFSIHLDENASRIRIDIKQLGQVILNLCINARDAMPSGGTISISTSNETNATGKHVVLTVKDTGQGMTDEVKKRLFEPFFTTKAIGEGTGLGLATVSEIVEHAQGRVEVQSEEGKGTTFKVYFPATDENPIELGKREIKGNLLGKEKILLVEDEERIRAILRSVLEDSGYHVTAAKDGTEGTQMVLDQENSEFDLVISDVRMPNRNGKDMITLLREKKPNMKVIYMSGYSATNFGQQGFKEDKITQYIQKPFPPTVLLDRVRSCFDPQ